MESQIPFNKQFDFEYESIERLSPRIRRIVAKNPNYFTFYGTNTYVVGNGDVALIDPGPDDQEHIEAIIDGLEGERVTHILITHSHYDHWPACQSLQKIFDAKTYGYHLRVKNRQDHSFQSEENRFLSNQERFEETGFKPDVHIEHGQILQNGDWSIEAVFTPGHASNHMCYQLKEEQALFSGDHVMGWSTSVISPPSGNMESYMESLALLLRREDHIFWPAHGPGIQKPIPFVKAFINHRNEREQQVVDQLATGEKTIREMVRIIYCNIPEALHPAAERSLLATILFMIKKGIVATEGDLQDQSRYFLI